ncbi:hypothetical protein LWI28_025262 [Acer negundo]|uniref:Vacuolar protein sorting-associated protein 13 VPS13 adaptor binding domain-containing protein n=1 Tax=Acer negundo TaxID=4023 RepID=A0AAD5IKD7_ACENE|nr:hypothetical protein LWI28_025262 [Acer negundo]
MVLTNLIHRKLSALLRPWLRDEPELELKLGIINSLAILNNFSLSTLAIDQLLNDDSSSLCVKEVNVDYMSLRFSNWSVSAFNFEVRGVHVTLSVREIKEGRSRRDHKSSSLASEDAKNSISAIDPEGSALHDVLERILNTKPSRDRIATSFLNLILNHCRLQMLSIDLQLQFPIADDSFVYISEIKELNAESLSFQQGCLLRGLVGALFRPLKESSFVINGIDFEIFYKRNDHVNRVCNSNGLFTCVKLDKLQLVDFHLRIPDLVFLFSPFDVRVLAFLGKLSSKESKHARNGRLLWKLALRRIGYVISAPSLSLHNLVELVSLWLRYVNAYETLLILVGYSADHLLRKSVVKMSRDKMFVASVRNNWEVISYIEKEMPPEAIAQARRIARYRAASNVQHAEDSQRESSVYSHLKVFSKILPLLACIWKIMYRMFYIVLRFLFLLTFFTQESESAGHLGIVSEYSCPQHCFILNLEKVLIRFSPENSVKPVSERVESQIGTPYSDFLSFSLSVDALILMFLEDISEKSLSISCGQLNVISSTFTRDPIMKSSSKTFNASPRGHRKGRVNNVNSILRSEPAQMFPFPETSKTIPIGHAEGECNPVLENLLGDMWLNWKNSCKKFEDSEIEYSENPWLLCEIKSFLTYPEQNNPDSGFWKCNLAVGKLNLVLGYSSILSITILLQQMKHALCWDEDIGKSRVISTDDGEPEINSCDKYEHYANGIKMALLRMLPEKHIQVGVLIAGPHIQMPLKKVGFLNGNEAINLAVDQDDFHLEFDVHNIEFVVLPVSKSDFTPFTRLSASDDEESECIRLMEPHIIDIPNSDNEKYASQGRILLSAYLRVDGLNAYLADSVEKQHNQIFALKPITIHFSSLRDSVHSLTTTVIAFSAALGGMASGFMIMSFMDELYVFFQMVVDLLSTVSDAFSSPSYVGNLPFEEFMRHHMVSLEHENKETALRGESLICTSTLLSLNGTFKLKSMDIIFYNSRISNKIVSVQNIDASSDKKLPDDLLDCGFWISVHKTCMDIFCEEEKMEALINLSGIMALMFRYADYMGKHFDHLVLRNLLLQSHNCLHELSLSNCIFASWFGCPHDASSLAIVSDRAGSSNSGGNISHSTEASPLTSESEKSDFWSCRFVHKLGITPDIFTPAPSHWILINVAFGEVLMARCSTKNGLVGAHQVDKLLSSLSVGGEFQTVYWGIQGGALFLELTALEMFVCCFSLYLDRFANLLSILQTFAKHDENDKHGVDMTRPNNYFVEGSRQEILPTSCKAKRGSLEAFTLDMSKFSLVLVIDVEDGGVRELVLEVDARVNLEMTNMQKKFAIDFSRLSFLSQVLQESVENESELPHFSSVTSNESSSCSAAEEGPATVRYYDSNGPFDGASCSKNHVSKNDFAVDNCASDFFRLSHQNYILRHFKAFVSAEKLENYWVGSGFISGFDMTISLSELQMILSTVSSFSEISSKEVSSEMTQRHWSVNQGSDNSLRAIIPDGAIVAIQDVNQHTYFTVEGKERKYTLVGAIHYSLVGERALFRVKYRKQRRWESSVLWFSLISLYAKNDSGQPLRLNYRSGSYFVDISCTDDSGSALWRMFPCDPESDKGDADWEPHNELVKKTFYLVNKKNDCAVAFVDGIPEFVRKPGNPFKFKVFHNLPMASDFVTSERYLDASVANRIESEDEGRTSGKSGHLPCIDITIDKVTLTIVHELLKTKDRIPLLCGCISNTQLTIQILSTKTRVINTSSALLSYFDAQNNLWRELIHPVEICIYHRSSSQIQGSELLLHRVPVHIYCKTKELEIFLTELSLDILLFVIGRLNLAGPYLIRSSRILANCCKVENHSGLNLHCHFDNQQSVTIGRKQSASIFLRHSTSANLHSDISSVVSIQLSVLGAFTTSINLSLLEARSLAWRTRIVSAQDSKTYPGPFIVVDISRKSEDGLSVVVSPLVRIHNETEFSMELRFRRIQEKGDEFASVSIKPGDSIDDSMATFDAISFSGGLKKALMSLSVGNFLFSFRPDSPDGLINSKSSLSVEWSDELKGGKAVCLSGIFDKLSYEVRKALSVESDKCSFSTACCALKSKDTCVAGMHFLIQSIRRNVPIIEPDTSSDGFENKNLPIALQELKEIFLLPTVRVSNLLHLEIHVLLTETDLSTSTGSENIGKQATIPCGSMTNFYANPAIMYFTVTFAAFRSSCKPVNSSDWVKKLLKHKNDVRCLDIDLDFGAGKYYASLRLSRGHRGILEAAIFTSYTLKNETDVSLFLYAPNQKPLSRDEVEKFGSSIPPELGLLLPPKSTRSWFSKSHQVKLKLLEDHSSEAMLDLDAISGLTEINLVVEEESGFKYITKFGVSVGPSLSKIVVPSQITTIVPRHVVANESEESIIVRQCYLEDNMEGMIQINSKQRTMLQLRDGVNRKREFSLFENFIRKHRNDNDKSLMFIQFRPSDSNFGWSGPLCISSLGRFFLKFRKQSNQVTAQDKQITEFAAVHVAEEGSTLVVHFHKPPNVNLPYRIENCLHGASITYYQKDSSDPEVLGSECTVDYVWDDLTLPHKLVVLINDVHQLREINLDKVRPWKPLFKLKQHKRLASHLLLDKILGDRRTSFGEFNVGYEVCAEGPTRVLRICEFSDCLKGDSIIQFSAKIQLRISQLAIHLLEPRKQDLDESDALFYTPIIVGRLGNINLDSVFTDQQKYNQICVQSLNVEHKWLGAPFAAMLRRHQLDSGDSDDCVFKIVCVLLSTRSNVKRVKYSSVVLQPVDLNIDEETLMRIVSFWRTSLSDSNTQSRQFYFDHFEIHPIKITANFLPGDSYSSYNSAQETLRSLLHSVVKVPSIKNMVVELNGVLVTHALLTTRELFNKCAQHYLWYAMRSIYIAKGSPLLPPSFASIFDDSASSSLDVFFDPSRGLMNLPGVTLGTFKLISKCIDDKGFSGTKRYFGDLGKTLRTAGSNVVFAAVTEISDSVLKGAETSGFDGLVSGFHQGILKLAMEPSLLGTALMGAGPDRKIKLDQSPGIDELYIEGYLQAMLDTMYRQEYLRVRVIDNQVLLKNLPPNNALIEEIMDRVKEFLVSKALLKGDPSTTSRPLRHLRGESEWKIGPTVLTLCEHLFVSFAIRLLRRRADKLVAGGIKWKKEPKEGDDKAIVPAQDEQKLKFIWKWGIGKFIFSGILAYIDGRLCRSIPNPVARRIVGGFLLSFLDKNDS